MFHERCFVSCAAKIRLFGFQEIQTLACLTDLFTVGQQQNQDFRQEDGNSTETDYMGIRTRQTLRIE